MVSQEGRKTTSEVDDVIPEPGLAKAPPRPVDFRPVDFRPVDLWLFEMQKTGQGEKKPRATRAPLLPTSGLKHGECRTAAEAMKGPPR